MRPILFAAAVIGAELLASSDAMAKYYPWCSFYTREAAENCSFSTYEQCIKNISGVGGWCSRNPDAAATAVDGPKSASIRPVRKKADVSKRASIKDRSIVRPAATTGISMRASPGTRTSIPLPDQALLTPPPEFACEFRTMRLDDASGQPQPRPTPTETDRDADAALRMKLDYERQCYQHGEMILRDRLLRVQAAVGETIEAADRSERPAASTGLSRRPGARTLIPRPDQALMTPPAKFSCEFRTTSLDGARGQPQPPPPPAEAGRGTEAALRMKLDYERQCYQHAEMILRDRLRRLQAAVAETIKAAER
jgi:Protein of unknown function (DUF3551)